MPPLSCRSTSILSCPIFSTLSIHARLCAFFKICFPNTHTHESELGYMFFLLCTIFCSVCVSHVPSHLPFLHSFHTRTHTYVLHVREMPELSHVIQHCKTVSLLGLPLSYYMHHLHYSKFNLVSTTSQWAHWLCYTVSLIASFCVHTHTFMTGASGFLLYIPYLSLFHSPHPLPYMCSPMCQRVSPYYLMFSYTHGYTQLGVWLSGSLS